jgi:dihydrofolate synthase / folylpolyglutamate synthase
MDFEETVDWLYGFQKFGIKLGLERINHIARELGDPQKKYKLIHVGGTNGKGSVCKFLESVLSSSGYNVGVYTSPHLQHISERIVVGNNRITDGELILLVNKIKPIVDGMLEKENAPTFFEVFTALAFQYFSDKNVDFAVIEVGLGGRYDATNIVDPAISIITNVSLEHQNILGKNIEDIAFEKAGIIKNNVPVITASKNSALKIIEEIAKEKNAPISTIGKKNWKRLNSCIDNQEFLIKGFLKDYPVRTSMMGRHQGENITLALAAIEKLQMNGTYITDTSIIEGIEKTVNPGRMEIVSYDPLVLLDGAHNKAGMQTLVDTLKNDFEYDRLIVVLGILSDKDIRSMLSMITPFTAFFVITKSNNARACDPNELKKMIEKLGYKNEVVVKERILDALEYSKSIAKKEDLICVTGSLFTVGEARDYLSTK